MGVEKQLRGRPRGLRIVDVLGNHGHGLGRDARLRKDVHGTQNSGTLHMHIGALQLTPRNGAIVALAFEANRQYANLAVACLHQRAGGRGNRRAVIDAHERQARIRRLIADHHRQPAAARRLQVGIPCRHGVDHKAIHRGRTHQAGRLRLALRTGRDKGERGLRAGRGFCHAGQEIHRGHVLEGIGEVLGQQHAHRARAASAQAAGRGVRPGIPPRLRRRQDALARCGRKLVRPAIGIGYRRARNTQLGGQRGQRFAGGAAFHHDRKHTPRPYFQYIFN